MIATFQERLSERFNGEAEPVITWTDQGKAKYEFEVMTLPNGTQLLQGFDPNHKDEQVFDAMLVPGQSPDILHCSILIREMESAINEQIPEQTDEKHLNRRSGKASAKPNREELQV